MSSIKDQIRAEIERRWTELADKNVKAGGGKYDAEISTYLSVLVFLETLPEQERIDEVKDAALKLCETVERYTNGAALRSELLNTVTQTRQKMR